ncbi:STM4015 family protein [Luteolibacter yonseiensis]|uniref:STM4015 family protein n=1 Tax=Luteolibacter yonseiensis TaxID=1144680 RepID=A0A934R1H4_9BACT|nr:STM4015 family protein [Luteolibacter yonseiensis]MBK1815039.1 STM4015 family protein [Luteolibacter yonseiensis]
MLNDSHLENWFGLPVEEASGDTRFQPSGAIYRFGYSYDAEESPLEHFQRYLESPEVADTVAIIFGMADEAGGETGQEAFLDLLESGRAKLPKLRGMFLGDITQEENEMSWIQQGDISRVLRIFPELEELRSRGQDGLAFQPCRHLGLKRLIIETGGMPKAVLHGIADSAFPELERLELWLGTDEYGFDGSLTDVLPLLNPEIFPKLKHLALGNSDIQNEIATALADSPILDKLESLDLSLGVMTDEGAAKLLDSPRVRNLKKLNLHRNFISESVANRFQSLGIEVDVDGQEKPDEYNGEIYRYVAVGE